MKFKKLTLIELIITILVLALLVGLAIPQFTGVKANADVASFKNDIDVLTKAIDESYVKEDSLPIGDAVTVTDPNLLDAIYASGDSGENLFKVDLTKTEKYHSKLKTKVTSENYFIYSSETRKVFYTKGQVDEEGQVLYSLEYIGLSNVMLGSNPLKNGMSVPVIELVQTITGTVPVDATVKVSVNGTDTLVTVEDVVFDGNMDLMAAAKMKTFTSSVTLAEGKNVVAIKVNSAVTNYNIYLGAQGSGGQPTPTPTPTPVIKPIAVISMTPEEALTTATNITWSYAGSTTEVGRTITGSEWEGNQNTYLVEGSYTVKLRVQDSASVWSDWTEKTFFVEQAAVKLSTPNYTEVKSPNNRLLQSSYVNYEHGSFIRINDELLRLYSIDSTGYLRRVDYDNNLNAVNTQTYVNTPYQYKTKPDFSVSRYNGHDYLVNSEGKLIYLYKFNDDDLTYTKTLIKDLLYNDQPANKIVTQIDDDNLFVYYDNGFDNKEYLLKYNISSNTVVNLKQITLLNKPSNGFVNSIGKPSITQDENSLYFAVNRTYTDDQYPEIILIKISKETLLTENYATKSFVSVYLYQPKVFFDKSGFLWMALNTKNNTHVANEGLYSVNFVAKTLTRAIPFVGDKNFSNTELMPDGKVRFYQLTGYLSYFTVE